MFVVPSPSRAIWLHDFGFCPNPALWEFTHSDIIYEISGENMRKQIIKLKKLD